MDDLTAFLELSALLTGLEKLVNDPDDRPRYGQLADEYSRRLGAVLRDGLTKLLGLYKSLASAVPKPALDDALLEKLRGQQDFKDNEFVARQIVDIWYFSQFRASADAAAPFLDGGFFREGEVWPIIGAHPTGFSHEPFGYWENKPAPSA